MKSLLLCGLGLFSLLMAAVGAPPRLAVCSEIAGYPQWHKVNPERHYVPNPTAILCRQTIKEAEAARKADPHVETFVTVYVNKTGKPALRDRKQWNFPIGSVVVKEKWEAQTKKDSALILKLMTVMIKREKGYFPKGGDWEYLVTNPKMQVLQRGKLESCQKCHVQTKTTGYLFRHYLPETQDKPQRRR
jgi:hypothetical protein